MAKKKKMDYGSAVEKIAFAGLGSVACLMANSVIDKVVDSAGLDEATKGYVAKAVPVVKLGAGTLGVMKTKNGSNMQYAAIGFSGTAAVETVNQFSGDMFKIGGSGSLFDTIGSSGRVIKLQVDTSDASSSYEDENDIMVNGTGREELAAA